jgi:DNA-directed RNA polymerase subunit RPC12/RpoP
VQKRGGYYDGNRYICKHCGKRLKNQDQVSAQTALSDDSISKTDRLIYDSAVFMPKEKSWWSKNWKIVIGIFFLIGGFGNIGEAWDIAIIGILIGFALLFSQYYPWISAKRQQKVKAEAEKAAKAEQQRAIAEQVKHCTTCGANTKGIICEYCGSILP